MASWLHKLWPRADVIRLRRENETLSRALQNATDTSADRLSRLEELRSRPCPACEVMKQTLNFHVLAAGSKVGVFDGIGPTVPTPAPRATPDPITSGGPIQASKAARHQRRHFMQEFLNSEAQIPVMDSEAEVG